MTNPRLLKNSFLLFQLLFIFLSSCKQKDKPIFTHEEVMQYVPKGPADCFRQISFDANEKKDYPQDILNTFFSEQDPVKYAAFCKKVNLSAVILQGVPQAGYATYLQTKINTIYPGMKGDFFGETLRELHKQGISGFGYVCIGWVLKFAKEHPEYTDGNKDQPLICLNSTYRDKVIESAKEIIGNYPVDGFRFDILDQPAQCRCEGCKKLYREMFNDSMPAQWPDWQQMQHFRLESIHRFVRDSYAACKSVKSSVPVWQNWFNGDSYADISDANYVDMSYLEFADPFFELFLNGIFDKKGIITGKVIEDPKRAWKCVALGGRCYSYFASVGKTGLPDSDTSFDRIVPPDWFEKKLAPFYAQVRDIEPYLENARPVTNVAILYNEKTRYHYDQYTRDDYMRILREITEPLLGSGNPIRFISNINLSHTPLDPYRAILIPESSGFSSDELGIIKRYAENGGIVLITGDALSYTASGEPMNDFALSDIMGVSRKEKAVLYKKVQDKQTETEHYETPAKVLRDGILPDKTLPAQKDWTPVISMSGSIISSIQGTKQQPLVHINPYGKGFIYYIASSEMPELTAATLNYAGIRPPVQNKDFSKLSVMTKRTDKNEWFLHLLDSGKYSLAIDKKYCAATKLAGTYLTDMKNIQIRFTKNSILIDVDNQNGYSLLILQ
jgi:hypothetical protein